MIIKYVNQNVLIFANKCLFLSQSPERPVTVRIDLTKAFNCDTMIKTFVGGTDMKRAALALSFIAALSVLVSCAEKQETVMIDPVEVTAEVTSEAETTAAESAASTKSATDSTENTVETETGSTEATAPTEIAAEPIELNDAGEGTKFSSGKVRGNVYTSEYAGIKVTFSEDMTLNDRAKNEAELKKIWSSLDERTRNEQEARITDLVANSEDTTYVFQYYNTKLLFPDKDSVTIGEFMAQQIAYSESDGIKVSAPETISIGGCEYTKESVIIDQIDLELVFYVRKIDDDFILVINSQGEAGFDHTILEKSIEAI